LRFQAQALVLLGRAQRSTDPDAGRAALAEAGELFRRAGDSAGAAEATRIIDDCGPGQLRRM
jgi:hypothetical protein